MNSILLFITLISLITSHVVLASEKIKQCNGTAWVYGSLGELETFSLGKKVSFEGALKKSLQLRIDETTRVMELKHPYRGPDEHYVPRLIELIEVSGTKAFSCLWREYKNGDNLREFSESEKYQKREGYILMRDGKQVAYMYTSVTHI